MYTETKPDIFLPAMYVPWAQKKARDWKWIEDMAEYHEYLGDTREHRRLQDKITLNSELYNGRFDATAYLKHNNPIRSQWLDLPDDFDYSKIKHFSMIDIVAKSIVGEQRRRNLNITIFNVNADSVNQRKAKKIELLQQYLDQNILSPIREQATQMYMQENNIQDPYSLTAEQQTQAKNEIEQRTQAMAPSDILRYMKKEYRTIEDKQLSRLYDYLRYKEQLKFKTDQAFEQAIITGTECYYVPIVNRDVKISPVNSKGLKYHLNPDKYFIEDSEWVTYESFIPYSDVLNDYALTPKQIKELNGLVGYGNRGSNGYENMKHLFEARLVSAVKENPALEEINPLERGGQEDLKNLYERYGLPMGDYYDMRSFHCVFKSSRKIYVVERPNLKTGQIETFFFGENYKRQPQDLTVTERYAPELYQNRKFGYGSECISVEKGPLPFQHRSLNNPFDIKGPYVGADYSRLMGNSENVSLIDLGTPWQFRLDVELTRLDELLGADIGPVLLMNMAAVPKDWDIDRFHQFVRTKRIAPLDFSQEGLGPFDAQVFKSVDLSTGRYIQERLAFVEYLKNQVAYSMSYNPSRLGVPIANTPVTNNQQNIFQSTLQTETVFAMHNIVVANLVTAALNAARIAFKDNPIKASYILDDMSFAELELDSELLWRSEVGVFITNDSEEVDNLRITKELLQPMIQNQIISGTAAIRMLWAKSGTEVLGIAEEAQEKMQQLAQQQAEQQLDVQQKILQAQAEIQRMLKQQDIEFQLLKQQRDLDSKAFIAGVQSNAAERQFANQYDIDKDGVNDANQRERERIVFEREKLNKELALEEKLTMEKLKVEKIKANKPRKVS